MARLLVDAELASDGGGDEGLAVLLESFKVSFERLSQGLLPLFFVIYERCDLFSFCGRRPADLYLLDLPDVDPLKGRTNTYEVNLSHAYQ